MKLVTPGKLWKLSDPYRVGTTGKPYLEGLQPADTLRHPASRHLFWLDLLPHAISPVDLAAQES